MTKNPHKLIHVARIYGEFGEARYLFLHKMDDHTFRWFVQGEEHISSVSANTIEEAIRLAYRYWKHQYFRSVHCGFRYTLPERDEHGQPALFHQMAASLSSMNGIYYDEELGNNCFVQNASLEARDLWARKLEA